METRHRLSVLIGLALLIGTPVLWSARQPAPSVGQVPASEDTAMPMPTPDDETSSPATPPPPSATFDVETRNATLTPSSDEQVRPAVLRIPALDVESVITEVGVEPDGVMEIPERVATAGWYRFGPVPGDEGSAVIAGHVDSRTQGRGAFFRLRELGLGATVEVELSDGTRRAFRTVARETYDKAVIPLDDVFARSGPARLALITCGGEFDFDTRHYRANVVVYAVPVGA